MEASKEESTSFALASDLNQSMISLMWKTQLMLCQAKSRVSKLQTPPLIFLENPSQSWVAAEIMYSCITSVQCSPPFFQVHAAPIPSTPHRGMTQ